MISGTVLLLLCTVSAAAPPQASSQAPLPAEAERIQAYIDRADELISDKNYESRYTDHYQVKTDDPRFEVSEAANLLESFRIFFDGFWSDRIDLHPYDDPGRVYLFYSRYKYKQLLDVAEVTGIVLPVGHYRAFFDAVSIHTDTVSPADFPDVLVHEAAHQLVQQRLFGGARETDPWIAEGLASYFGYTLRDDKNGFQAGRIGGKDVALIKEVRAGSALERTGRFNNYRKDLRKGQVAPLEDLIRDPSAAAFYNDQIDRNYAASWLLVHFLLHGDDGAHAGDFIRFLESDARREGGADEFFREIGMEPADLQAAFKEYVSKLKAR
jgi:hypothetical protein